MCVCVCVCIYKYIVYIFEIAFLLKNGIIIYTAILILFLILDHAVAGNALMFSIHTSFILVSFLVFGWKNHADSSGY